MIRYQISETPEKFINEGITDIIQCGDFDRFVESTGMEFVCFVPTHSGGVQMLFKEPDS